MQRTATLFLLAATLLVPGLAAGQQPDTAWVRQLGASGLISFATDIRADADGNVWVCGQGRDGAKADEDLLVARLNAWGDTIWVRYLDGELSGSRDDIAHALAVDTDGNVYVAGALEIAGERGLDMVVAKFSPAGDLLWDWISGVDDDDIAFSVAVGNGQVYAAGTMWDPVNSMNTFTMLRLNPDNGALIWRNDTIVDVNAMAGGRDRRRGPGPARYPEWYEDWWDYENCATAIAIAPNDGNVVATGYGLHSNREYQVFTVKRNTNGGRVWADHNGRTTSDWDDVGFALAIDNSGQVFVAGMGEGDVPYYDWLVLRYNSSGSYQNRYTLNSPWDGDEWANAITLDDSTPQNVYVTGFLEYAPGSGAERIVTQKLSNTLTRRWGAAGAQYQVNDGNHPDIGYSVSHAQGHIFVTGRSGETGRDLVLLCYTTATEEPKYPKWVRMISGGSGAADCGNTVFAVDTNHIYIAGQRRHGIGLANDSMSALATRFFHPWRDVAPDSIVAPAPEVLYGEPVTPTVRIRNDGNDRSSFEVRLHIAPGHYDTAVVTNLLPGETGLAVFSTWTAGPMETLAVTAVTALVGDDAPANDTLRGTVIVGGTLDIAAAAIAAPTGTIDTMRSVVPAARIENRGDVPAGFTAWMFLRDPDGVERYRQSAAVASLAPGADTVLGFPAWPGSDITGQWSAACSVAIADDEPANDIVADVFRVEALPSWPPGWVEMTPMPASPSGRQVRDGGLVVTSGDRLYAFKGNKTAEFFAYDIDNNNWTPLPPVPPGPSGKTPGKGAAALAHDGYVYLVKGNGTNEFWRFDTDPDILTWESLPAVPPGVSGARVKYGTGLAALKAGTGQTPTYFYLLKGNRSDFLRYDPESRAWLNLPDLPVGIRPRWNRGSWLVTWRRRQDDIYHLYAHKARWHELWRFDAAAGTWDQAALPGMPYIGMTGRSRKARDGSCATLADRALWALKGGNTQDLWRFSLDSLSWREYDTIPSVGSTGKRKRVKGGGNITAARGAFFALKGNKTLEFWRYVIPPTAMARPERSGVMAGETAGAPYVKLGPNPLAGGFATLRYSLPTAGPASVNVFDVTGRTVLSRSFAATRSGAVGLDLRSLSAGIYLVKVEADGFSGTQKLVVQQ